MRDGFVCFDRGDLLRVMEAQCIGMEGQAWHGSMADAMGVDASGMDGYAELVRAVCAGACPMSWPWPPVDRPARR